MLIHICYYYYNDDDNNNYIGTDGLWDSLHPEEIEDIVNEIISIKHDPFSRSSISVASLSSILADAIGAQAKKFSTTVEDEGRVSPIVEAAREWTRNPTADRYKSLKCGNADDITVVVSVVVVPSHQLSCCSQDSEQRQQQVWKADKGICSFLVLLLPFSRS